ncbi:hypothetical protein ACNKHS_05410 [Shigella flexneri]
MSDSSKYYRLIEASLYSAVSPVPWPPPADYPLPENSGVRKAFQDMEAALRENPHDAGSDSKHSRPRPV